jgi:hypothetical protein
MEPIIHEKRNYLHILIPTLVSTILVTGSYFLYQEYKKAQVIPDTSVPLLTSYGLDTPIDPDTTPYGTITYTVRTLETAEADAAPYIYRYNLDENNTEPLFTTSMSAALPYTATSSIVIKDNTVQLYNHDTETFSPLPTVPNVIISDLTLSPDQTRYAYTYREADLAEPENLNAYSIAIHTLDSAEVEVVEGGGKPAWVDGGSSLFYLATDGLYSHDFNTAEKANIFNLYSTYTPDDNLAVSPDSTTLILTIPSLHLISVITIDTTDTIKLTELGRIVTSSTTYHNPLFTADSLYYVVQAKTGTKEMMEVLAVNNGMPVGVANRF